MIYQRLSLYNNGNRQKIINRVKAINTGGFTFDLNFDGTVRKYNHTKDYLRTLDYVNLGAMIEFIYMFKITNEELQ